MPLSSKLGRHFSNPKVMEQHERGMDEPMDMGNEMPVQEGHPEIHHIEIHPHGPSAEHPHHLEVHHHDGNVDGPHEHGSYDEAAAHGKELMHGEGPNEEMEEEKISPGIHEKVRKADSGAY